MDAVLPTQGFGRVAAEEISIDSQLGIVMPAAD